MSLFRVIIQHDLVVNAKDTSGARVAALDALREPSFDDDPIVWDASHITRMQDLPSNWTGESIPWGDRVEGAETIAEQLGDAQ